MKTWGLQRHRWKSVTLMMVVAVCGACSNADSGISLSRSAKPLATNDALLDVKSGAGASADAQAKGGGVALHRTTRDSHKVAFDLRHAWLAREDLAKDVAAWGVIARIRSPKGKASELTSVSLNGSFDISLRDGDGLYTVELAPSDFATKENPRSLGAAIKVNILRDTTSPSLEVVARTSESVKLGKGEINIGATYKDAAPPVCRALELLDSGQTVMAKLAETTKGSAWIKEASSEESVGEYRRG